MDFRILGPVEVSDGAPIALGGSQQRVLLTLLVGHAGETLATEVLVDELWGEAPPPTAVKTVQVYVSQLRKLLGVDRLQTQGRGYRLVAAPHEIDARRFELAIGDGALALEQGHASDALTAFEAAEREWRGRALEGAETPWARSEAARLEGLRQAAREDRIEAQLELGRHSMLTAELEVLTSAHPLRERLAGQRMLALYRSGRQADALDAFSATRERLVADLGIEPGPELRTLQAQILAHDPALAAPPRERTVAARRRRGLGAVLVMVAALALAVIALTRDQPGALAPPGANTVTLVDPRSLEVVARLRVGDAPSAVALAAGGAWIVNANDETISFVDAGRRQVARTIVTRGTPADIAAGAGSIWVVDRPSDLVRIDPQTARVTGRIRLTTPGRPPPGAPGTAPSLAAGEGEVWVVSGRWLWRVRPSSRNQVRRVAAPLPGPLALGSSAWVGGLAQVERSTLRVVRRLGLGLVPVDVAVGAGAIWLADSESRSVLRVDPRSGRVTRRTRVGGVPTSLSIGAGAVWAALRSGAIVRLDHRSGAVTGRAQVGGSPRALAAGGGVVWTVSG